MNSAQMGVLLRHIRTLAADRSSSSPLDGELLERFSASRDEEAFADLVQRHGPMVWSVCRHVLHNWHDAEDVFQATFLVLARKAAGIYRPESLASWLYGVAYHLAVKAQARSARQRVLDSGRPREPSGVAFEGPARLAGPTNRRQDMASADPLLDMTWRELRTTLYEELARLPAKNRTPLVLCYLQGKTQGEAARLLGWTKETVRGRLDRGREQLRKRLTRRGLALTSALFSTLLAHDQALAVPASLLKTTVKSAALMAAGKVAAGAISSKVAALASGGLKDLFVAKVKICTAFLLAVGLFGTGIGTITQHVLAQRQGAAQLLTEQKSAAKRSKEPLPAPQQARAQNKRPVERQIIVTGRVLDEDGNPITKADVAVVGWRQPVAADEEQIQEILGTTKADVDGRYRLIVPETSKALFQSAHALASGKGYGLGWHLLDPDARQAEAVIRLLPEQVIHVRIIDLQGQPAAGVKLHAAKLMSKDARAGEISFAKSTKGVPVIPGTFTSNDQGRVTVRGIGRGYTVVLDVRDDRFAPQELRVQADKNQPAKDVVLTLAPAQILDGQVTYADSRKPVAGAWLKYTVREGGSTNWQYARADRDGHYRISLPVGHEFLVTTEAPKGQPYVGLKKDHLQWPKGTTHQQLDFALPPGVLFRVKVAEAPSGKPVSMALVQFFPKANNPHQREDALVGDNRDSVLLTGSDGMVELVGLPGPGSLLVESSNPDYIRPEIGAGKLLDGQPGGKRLYPDALVEADRKAGAQPEEVKVTLRRGVAIRGEVVGPDGKPVTKGQMFCSLASSDLPRDYLLEYFLQGGDFRRRPVWRYPVEIKDGRFELRGCDPEKTYSVYFLDDQNHLGASTQLSGKQPADKPVAVRLERCASATPQLLDEGGKPFVACTAMLLLVVSPGPSHFNPAAANRGALYADLHRVLQTESDGQGKVSLPKLIPGATYRVIVLGTEGTVRAEGDFTGKPGQNLRLTTIAANKSP
jgi:RNA polymerase sigma factor (sigma-70 family)